MAKNWRERARGSAMLVFREVSTFSSCVATLALAYFLLFKPSGGRKRRQLQPKQQQQEEEPRLCTALQSSMRSGPKPSTTFLKESVPADSVFARFVNMITEVQDQLCSFIIAVDGGEAQFKEHVWYDGDDGGRIIKVLQESAVWDKVAVNVEVLYGVRPSSSIPNACIVSYSEAGINAVLHPKNPFAPTLHFNYGCIETNPPQDARRARSKWLFTGACELTPAYIFEDDVKLFHSTLKGACDKFVLTFYPRFKKQYDDYFVIKHRGEKRGLGGIYFDDLDSYSYNKEMLLSFVTECARSVIPAYISIIEKRKNLSFTIQNKAWQQLRRGRFVEFILVCDKFITGALKSDGMTREIIDGILASLPLTARWEYDHIPDKGSEEQKLLDASKARLPQSDLPWPCKALQSSMRLDSKPSKTFLKESAIFTRFVEMIRVVQDQLCSYIMAVDGRGAQFKEEVFQSFPHCIRIVKVLQDSTVWDKASIIFSAESNVGHIDSTAFFSSVLSSFICAVLHPKNPFAPTLQLYYEYSEINPPHASTCAEASGVLGKWRFTGETDLIPAYIFEEDVKLFHSTLKGACDKFDLTFYPRFKKECDDYFFIKHRGERRGLGGLVFDDLNSDRYDRYDKEMLLSFVTECANCITPAYMSIMEKRKNLPVTDQNRAWQQLRRGRFVEFNLVCPNRTTYGMNTRGRITEGRIERILYSLPLTARWEYGHIPEEGSEERKLLDVCIKPKEWA